MTSKEMVLVTGGSGFIGSRCILQLLEKGYGVRTTVRKLARKDEVREMLEVGGATPEAIDSVEFVAADLLNEDGWAEAVKGCRYVLHVASPFPPGLPKHEDELIIPARDGTLRVLKAAKAAGVKRVVVTSSVAAVMYGRKERSQPLTEKDWTILDDPAHPVPPYQKSKTLAERAAWDWYAKEAYGTELSVVNPVAVFGPLLAKDTATSIQLVSRLMNGEIPAIPRISFGAVDVRDVADLHIRAMTDPKANGQRYIATGGPSISMKEVAAALKARMGAQARRVPSLPLPDIMVRLIALFDPTVKMILSELGRVQSISSDKAITELGWKPRSQEDAVVATAETLERVGLLKK